MSDGWRTRSALDALLTVLLAPTCAACRAALDRPLDGPICRACWEAVPKLTPPVCTICGDPLPSWRVISQATAHCPRCRRTPRGLDAERAVGPYDGSLRAIVRALKYGGHQSIATRLGALMADAGHDLLPGVTHVVPVPLHPRRLRHRGFNQAACLARALGPPAHVLRRIRYTVPQAPLPAARRHANVRDAFALTRAWPGRGRQPRSLEGARVLLVDDVRTTGATLEACARVLKTAGAVEVRGLTAARAQRDGR